MSTRQIIAAAASIAILGSTIAVFRTSSHARVERLASISASAATDGRPVQVLDTVVVHASALPQAGLRGASEHKAAPVRTSFVLTSLHSSNLHTGTPLFMPYYSFANNLHTIIKD